MKRINVVNVCGTISFLSMIATVGFTEGSNYIGTVVCMVMCVGFAYLALREDGTFRQKNRPR